MSEGGREEGVSEGVSRCVETEAGAPNSLCELILLVCASVY